MTEHKDAVSESDAENNEYLYEPFITHDGLEVPPPTRPMGPRRLARYRDDAAAYLRAQRDGKPLPDEPVAYMPSPADDQDGLSDESLQVQRKFIALSTLGDIKGPDEENDLAFTSRGDLEGANLSQLSGVQSLGEQTEGSSLNLAPAGQDVSTDISYSGDLILEDDPDSTELFEAVSEPAKPVSEKLDVRLPLPVPALKAQGLDLRGVDNDIDDDGVEAWNPLNSTQKAAGSESELAADSSEDPVTPWTASSQQVQGADAGADELSSAPADDSPSENFKSLYSDITEKNQNSASRISETESHQRDVLAPEAADDTVDSVGERSSPKTGLWLLMLLFVVLIAVALFFVL